MKKAFKLLLFSSFALAALLYVMSSMSGKPLVSSDIVKFFSGDKAFSSNETTPAADSSLIQTPPPQKLVTVYKWKDKNGVWQFSDQPNMNGDCDSVRINAYENVVHFKESPKTEEEKKKESKKIGGFKLPSPTTIPLADIPKLIDKAKNVQNVLNARAERQREQIE